MLSCIRWLDFTTPRRDAHRSIAVLSYRNTANSTHICSHYHKMTIDYVVQSQANEKPSVYRFAASHLNRPTKTAISSPWQAIDTLLRNTKRRPRPGSDFTTYLAVTKPLAKWQYATTSETREIFAQDDPFEGKKCCSCAHRRASLGTFASHLIEASNNASILRQPKAEHRQDNKICATRIKEKKKSTRLLRR